MLFSFIGSIKNIQIKKQINNDNGVIYIYIFNITKNIKKKSRSLNIFYKIIDNNKII